MSFVHAKRAADFREGARQHNTGYVIHCRRVCDTPGYYIFTNNSVLMRNIWNYYSYCLCISKDKINERRGADWISFQTSILKGGPQCIPDRISEQFQRRSQQKDFCSGHFRVNYNIKIESEKVTGFL